MAKAKWQIEAEKREAAERQLVALRERIPKVLAECVLEYDLAETVCVEGLQDFCSRLGAADYTPHMKGNIVIVVENMDLPGRPGRYGIEIHDETLEQDLATAVNDFLGKRYPNASWDTSDVSFEHS